MYQYGFFLQETIEHLKNLILKDFKASLNSLLTLTVCGWSLNISSDRLLLEGTGVMICQIPMCLSVCAADDKLVSPYQFRMCVFFLVERKKRLRFIE
jgi:hypothetical protein